MLEKFSAARPAFTFPEFLQYCETLAAEGRTSGPDQSEFLVYFTKLNLQRMKRWYRTVNLSEAIQEAARQARPQHWYVITEAWCGDSAQNLPVIARIADASAGKIALTIVLRDAQPELMDAYLTKGSRSIPKLVSFTGSGEELFVWGPRPEGAEQLFQQWKAQPDGRDFEAFEKELHTWYHTNNARDLQEVFASLILK